MTKLRAEVRAAMEAERGESDSVPAASTPKVSRTNAGYCARDSHAKDLPHPRSRISGVPGW